MNNSLAQIIELLTTIYYVTVTLKKEKEIVKVTSAQTKQFI